MQIVPSREGEGSFTRGHITLSYNMLFFLTVLDSLQPLKGTILSFSSLAASRSSPAGESLGPFPSPTAMLPRGELPCREQHGSTVPHRHNCPNSQHS